MKEVFKKYKEIIIAFSIIIIVLVLIGINYYKNYQRDFHFNLEEGEKQIIENESDKNVEYIEFFNDNQGIMYKIEDVAMTIAFGTISKTNDGGKTWEEVSHGIDGVFKIDSQVKFFDENLGFITMPNNGGNSCELYNTQDGGKTFTKVEVNHIELQEPDLKWEDVYDYYNMPVKQNSSYYLDVGQGADGDYQSGNSIQYFSYDALTWTTQELEKNNREAFDQKFDERVANRSDKIFLKDFENYNPDSSEVKISQSEAEKIADIGFEEAGTIGENGDKETQKVNIEEVTANNFFTMDHNCISQTYPNIKRKCYVFLRENEMGNGSKVYVDVTTGLILGGLCFGD